MRTRDRELAYRVSIYRHFLGGAQESGRSLGKVDVVDEKWEWRRKAGVAYEKSGRGL